MILNSRKIISVAIGAIVVIVLILAITTLLKGNPPFKTTQKATVDNHTFKVNVAQTEKEKEIGLSDTKSLPDDYAMVFPFDQAGYYYFWMKNMKFSIDIIYIKDGKIVKIFTNVPTPQNNQPPKIYVSGSPADKVLEIKAGLSDKYKIKEGDLVTLQNI